MNYVEGSYVYGDNVPVDDYYLDEKWGIYLKKGFLKIKPIVAVNVSSKKKLYFRSQGKASKELGVPQSNIWKVLNKQRRTAGGYIFQEVLNG